MNKANKKTERFEMRVSSKLKEMAQRKSKKAGFNSVSAWLTNFIRRAK